MHLYVNESVGDVLFIWDIVWSEIFAQLIYDRSQHEIQKMPLNIGRNIHLVYIRFVLQIYDGQKWEKMVMFRKLVCHKNYQYGHRRL